MLQESAVQSVAGVTIPRFMTPKEVAAMLQIAEQTLACWRCSQAVNIPFLKIGRHVRYRVDDVMAFLRGAVKGERQC